MSRPGLKGFRRFISHRRATSRDEESYYDDDAMSWSDEMAVVKPAVKPTPQKSSSRIRMSRKPLPQPIVLIRHSEDIHRLSSVPPLPLPSPPRSSQSSLSSFEEEHSARPARNNNNGHLSPPVSSRFGIESPADSPPLCSAPSREDLLTARSFSSSSAARSAQEEQQVLPSSYQYQSPPSSRDGIESLPDTREETHAPAPEFNDALLLPMAPDVANQNPSRSSPSIVPLSVPSTTPTTIITTPTTPATPAIKTATVVVHRRHPSQDKPLPETPREEPAGEYSEGLEQFSRETEEAFRLEIPLTETELQKFCENRPDVVMMMEDGKSSSPSPVVSPEPHETAEAGGAGAGGVGAGAASGAGEPPHSPQRKSLGSPTRPISLMKLQQQHQQMHLRPRKTTSRRRTRSTKQSWISENAREFIGRFQRVEVNEMRSPEELEEISRRRRESQLEHQKSAESLLLSDAGTTNTAAASNSSSSSRLSVDTGSASEAEASDASSAAEPFHMQDLPSKISAAGLRFSSLPSPIPEVDTPITAVFDPEATKPVFRLSLQQDRKGGSPSPLAALDVDGDDDQHLSIEDATAAAESSSAQGPMQDNDNDNDNSRNTDGSENLPSPPPKSPARPHPQKELPPLPQLTVSSPDGATTTTSPLPTPIPTPTLALTPNPPTSPAPLPPHQQSHQRRPSSARSTATAASSSPRPVSSSDEYVYLPSTTLTRLVPGFAHGPIRIVKADLLYHTETDRHAAAVAAAAAEAEAEAEASGSGGSGNKNNNNSGGNDALDWTAFQMAILGGAGDLFGEAIDYGHQPVDAGGDRRALDEIVDWWASYGYDSPGKLVDAVEANYHEERKRQMRRLRRGNNKQPSVSSSSSGGHSAGSSFGSGVGAVPRSYIGGGSGGGGGGGGEVRASSPDLPIPVATEFCDYAAERAMGETTWLDLTTATARDHHHHHHHHQREEEEYEVPMMGSTLGHDLGDFLKWEAENVSAVGYFGAY